METRFWNCSDESVLDILTSAVQKMTRIYAERGEDALSYHEYKYAEQDYEDARAELLDRLQAEST